MKQSPYGPSDFQRDTGVSRETLDRLTVYADLLAKWNPKINLVASSTLPDLWRRHMLDSAQLLDLIPKNTRVVVDLGSGAGFPGLVLGIMGVAGLHLVESDQRKVAFLRESARATKTQVEIHPERIEKARSFPADVVTARALASLSELLEWAFPFMTRESLALFPKGQNVGLELTEAHKMWRMAVDQRPSRTDPSATILCVREVHRVSDNGTAP